MVCFLWVNINIYIYIKSSCTCKELDMLGHHYTSSTGTTTSAVLVVQYL